MKFYIKKMAKDTLGLTIVSLVLQGLGIFLNALISEKIGTASVGVMTLIFTLFGFIMVLANGNILISTSRFVSEEIGCGNKNVKQIMRYSLGFSLTLSITFTAASLMLANVISNFTGAGIGLAKPIRIIALSLPFASVGSCIKGFFNAVRKAHVACCGDCIEFSAKWVFLLFSVLVLVDKGYDIYILIALSILIGEFISCVFYLAKYSTEYRTFLTYPNGVPNIGNVSKYLRMCFPILISGYVQMILSTANDVLVPISLIKYNASSERALSEYGMFEAMIIPTIFYPSALLCSLSNILMPEIARVHSSGNAERMRSLVTKALSSSLIFAFFTAGLFFMQGKNIGNVLCPSDPLVGETLVKMFPVIPFIYLEIILESIIKGLGKQNFSTINSVCEYIIRIICVIVFVNLFGFTGVLISYYASNIYSNIIRIVVVCKTAKVHFNIRLFVLIPFIYSTASCVTASAVIKLVRPINPLFSVVIFISSACIMFIAVYEGGKLVSKDSSDFITIIGRNRSNQTHI